jgi:hypothetical protein
MRDPTHTALTRRSYPPDATRPRPEPGPRAPFEELVISPKDLG